MARALVSNYVLMLKWQIAPRLLTSPLLFAAFDCACLLPWQIQIPLNCMIIIIACNAMQIVTAFPRYPG